MDPVWKQKWIDALESGEYRHGKFQLQTECGAFCCLGVLCDISGVGEWDDGLRYGDRFKSGFHVTDAVRSRVGVGRVDFTPVVQLNDHPSTCDYSRQINWIKENL